MLKFIKISDVFILKLFNNNIKCSILDTIMPLITYLGSFQFALSYCLIALIYPNTLTVNLGIRNSATLISSTVIVQLLKRKIVRIRPFEVVENLYIKKIQIDQYSFPSGHTAAAFSLAMSTSFYFPNLAFVLFLLASAVAISRMYLGVHYPSDIVAAIIISILSSTVTGILINL